jgi:DnaJ family protein C protein 7
MSVISEVNGVRLEESERSPTPPPHTICPTPPQPVDAEAFKLAGNKYFKAGDYQKAIQEYTKG